MPSAEEILLKVLEGLSTGALKGHEAAQKLKQIENELELKKSAMGMDQQRLDQQGRTPPSAQYQDLVEQATGGSRPEGMEGPDTASGNFIPGMRPETVEEGKIALDFTGKKNKQEAANTTIYADPTTGDWDYKPGENKMPITVKSDILFKQLSGRNKGNLTVEFDENGTPVFKVKEGNITPPEANVILREKDQGLRKEELGVKERALKAREKLLTLKTPEGISLMKQLETKSGLLGVAKEGTKAYKDLEDSLNKIIDKANALGDADLSAEEKELEEFRKSKK